MGFFWRRSRAAEQEFADLLAECLAQIERGDATLESVLAAHPQQAERLRPLLETALATRAALAVTPSESVQARVRARVMAAAAPRPMPVRHRPVWQPAFAAGLALAFLVVLAVPVGMMSSDKAVPGDWDYGLKRAGERVRLAVTVDDDARRSLHLALAERRERELQALIQQNRTEYIPAAIRAFNQEIGSVKISLSKGSQISAPDASKIAEVSERQVQVLEQVAEQAPPAVLPAVEQARTTAQENRDLARRAAEQQEQQASNQPSPTPVATPRIQGTPQTATPGTPTPTATSTPAASPAPTATPSPSPSPSASPSPSGTPAPSLSPSPSGTPSSTTPAPAPTVPTGASQAQANMLPTPTPAPTPVPTLPPVIPQRTPLPTPGQISAPTPTPVPPRVSTTVPNPSLTPTPAPTPTPVPTPLPTSLAWTLNPGVNEFIYTGPQMPLLTVLAPITGKYTSVVYKAPNGVWVQYQPGATGANGGALVLSPGSQVSIIMTEPGVINLPIR